MKKPLAFLALIAFGASAAWAGGPSSDLSITKTDGALTSTPGGTITYTIIASNSGPSPAPGSGFGDLFTDPLENCTWTCVGQLGGMCSVAAGGEPSANQSVDLPVGGQVVVTVTCDIASNAIVSFFNTATITSPPGNSDPVGVNNSATDVNGLNPVADLSITKTDGTSTFEPGGSTIYTIVTSNNGPSDALGDVTDIFPASLGCNWTCVGSGGGICSAAGAGDITDEVGLPAGSNVTYTAICSIAPDAPEPLVNTASVSASPTLPDPTPGNNSATDADALLVPIPTLDFLGLAALASGLGLMAARRLRRR
ncbi:MAG TPA: IPTL-CTERM sorting domain-containing protein [Thermoanaerobaculia bacterium]|jgi:uncharacterized repeat protein (TIGR01451 family)|nr:IPTL-CTERM sorting domain-containing protein [Thermoanaerobaculia bacterium]